jgi:undecaprenyl-diphosphatase
MSIAVPAQPLSLLEACWHALVLGVVQGITEFLPISSTAHLKVVPVLLGWGDPGVAVTAVIQLGSIAAVLAYFREDLADVMGGISRAFRHGQWSDPQARLGVAIALGTLPILVAGLLLKKFVPDYDASPLRSMTSIAIVSIAMALLLALAEVVGARRRTLGEVLPRDGVLVGFAQALALVPGVSRSGSTLTASLFDGWQRPAAARFSFLLGIPAKVMAGIPRRKEKRAAAGRCPPSKREAVRVLPERETPGTKARAWANPTNTPSRGNTSAKVRRRAPNTSARANKRAITMDTMAMEVMLRRGEAS